MCPKYLWNPAWEHFYHIFSSLWGKRIWKMSPLVICKIVGAFFNILSAYGKYPLQKFENSTLPIQYRWNFKYFTKKKMSVITNVFPKLKPVKDVVRALSKKPIFRRPFERQHVKVSQTLVKSAWQHFYHNFSLPWEKITVENVCVSDM